MADHTKLGRLTLVKVCELHEVGGWSPIGRLWSGCALDAAGVEVVVA